MHQHLENLIAYAIRHKLIDTRDYVYVKNQLCHLLQIDVVEKQDSIHIEHPADALEPILDQLVKDKKIEENQISRDLFDAKIMNVFAPRPALLERSFKRRQRFNSKKATDWLYQRMIDLNYIRYDRVLKNKHYFVETPYASMEISINLAKPEKDPKAIALALTQQDVNYPKCVLCIENEGFSGNYKRDSRDQHRLIQIDLNQEKWYFQYSPYIYYNEHAIVIHEKHKPMKISRLTFDNLLTLTDHFEGYFFGSNADLPGVGGSILNHEHYQGGKYHFPIEDAKRYQISDDGDIQVELLKWPLSVIRLTSKNKQKLIDLANRFLIKWKGCNNPSLGILSETKGEAHNTITPIARKNRDCYELDLTFRNNRTSEKHPLGIFHVHEDKWHIKKENIGLIEVMGLAILPARLTLEMQEVKSFLKDRTPLSENSKKHQAFAERIKNEINLDKDNLDRVLETNIAHVFVNGLENCGVFKQNEYEQQTFIKWIEEVLHEKET